MILFFPTLLVISCSHLAISQVFKNKNLGSNQLVIESASAYKSAVGRDESKKMVLLKAIDPTIVIDLRYATKNNFTGQALYPSAMAFVRLPAALALKKVNAELHDSGLVLKIYDAYRPYTITKKMWRLVHDRRYVANPAKGSAHNRGSAVDVTLVNLSTGKEVQMPTPFDDFTKKAGHHYIQLPAQAIRHRALLKKVMLRHGFLALGTEWWHYILPHSTDRFEVLDVSFADLMKLQ